MKGFKSYRMNRHIHRDGRMDGWTDRQTHRQTDTQTDMTENITYPHTQVVIKRERKVINSSILMNPTNTCLQVCGREQITCQAGCQEVSRLSCDESNTDGKCEVEAYSFIERITETNQFSGLLAECLVLGKLCHYITVPYEY